MSQHIRQTSEVIDLTSDPDEVVEVMDLTTPESYWMGVSYFIVGAIGVIWHSEWHIATTPTFSWSSAEYAMQCN
eukprot:12417807-Karenia_brevis.AAC.1